jgi:hypothetical protein
MAPEMGRHPPRLVPQTLPALFCTKSKHHCGTLLSLSSLGSANLPGLTVTVDAILRCAHLHFQYACTIFNNLIYKPSPEKAHTMEAESVAHESLFITHTFPCSNISINIDHMTEYIQHTADMVLDKLHYVKVWHAENPFAPVLPCKLVTMSCLTTPPPTSTPPPS